MDSTYVTPRGAALAVRMPRRRSPLLAVAGAALAGAVLAGIAPWPTASAEVGVRHVVSAGVEDAARSRGCAEELRSAGRRGAPAVAGALGMASLGKDLATLDSFLDGQISFADDVELRLRRLLAASDGRRPRDLVEMDRLAASTHRARLRLCGASAAVASISARGR